MTTQILFKAIKYFGSQEGLAQSIGVSQQAVSSWLNQSKKMPYIQALKIFVKTKGNIPLDELAPEQKELNRIFGSSFILGSMEQNFTQGATHGEN